MSRRQIVFRANPELERAFAERASEAHGVLAKECLERYYALLASELERLRLSEAEASLVVDALNGILLDAHTVRLLWAEVHDAIRLDGLDGKWNVDGPALVAKLSAMTPGQTYALADAVERAWQQPGVPMSERLRQVGLVRGCRNT